MNEHDCTYCNHFELDEGWGGTEVTGGTPASIGCRAGHWTLEDQWTPKAFRLSVIKGLTCQDFDRTED